MSGDAKGEFPVLLRESIATAAGTYAAERTVIGWTVKTPEGDLVGDPTPTRSFQAVRARALADATRKRTGGPKSRSTADRYVRHHAAHNDQTGTVVEMLDMEHPDHGDWPIPPHGERWATVCVTHHEATFAETHQKARALAGRPALWCDKCAEILRERRRRPKDPPPR